MFKMKHKAYLLFVVLLLVATSVDAQCAMCRAVLETETDGGAAKGINNGIVYLMIFPYLLIGVVGYFVFKMRQKAKKQES